MFDVGVYKVLHPAGGFDSTSQINGLAFERLIAQHLKAWCDYTSDEYMLAFWRTRSGVEIDFIIYGPKGLRAVEVKSKSRFDVNDLRSLKAFKEDYPMVKTALVYAGEERLNIDGVLCLPANGFLLGIVPNKALF